MSSLQRATWHIWTDGAAVCHEDVKDGSGLYPGGWAAIVYHGIDGFALRGRETGTTNVRMELRAAIEGLREVPAGERVVLHFDCTVILAVRDRWKRREQMLTPRDSDMWIELAEQLGRVNVIMNLIGKGPNPEHRRAHVFAGAEARGAAAGLPAHKVPVEYVRKEHRLSVIGGVRQREAEDRLLYGIPASEVERNRMADAFEAAQRERDMRDVVRGKVPGAYRRAEMA